MAGLIGEMPRDPELAHTMRDFFLSKRRFFFSSRRRHTRWPRDWSSDVCSSDLPLFCGVLRVSIGLLGDGAVPMRLPSLIAGAALVGLAIAFGFRAGGAAVGIL